MLSLFLFLFIYFLNNFLQVNRGEGLVGFEPQCPSSTRGSGTTGIALELICKIILIELFKCKA